MAFERAIWFTANTHWAVTNTVKNEVSGRITAKISANGVAQRSPQKVRDGLNGGAVKKVHPDQLTTHVLQTTTGDCKLPLAKCLKVLP